MFLLVVCCLWLLGSESKNSTAMAPLCLVIIFHCRGRPGVIPGSPRVNAGATIHWMLRSALLCR